MKLSFRTTRPSDHNCDPMVHLPPPHLAPTSGTSYAEAYAKILAAHRRSPKTAASSVIILVAPDVDALCASKMLVDIFKQDDVMHRTIPVSGHAELERIRDELTQYTDVSPSDLAWLHLVTLCTATYSYYAQHGLYSRSPVIGVVW